MKQSPIYTTALADWKKNPAGRAYIGSTDTAKLIRAQLKAKFPGVKFSVRTDKYSGGSSIRIGWTDGPTTKLVDAVVQPYAGSGFDGMTDYKYSVGAWLMPDGSVATRSIEAHWGTDGETFECQADGAIPVRICADFIFTSRELTLEHMNRALLSYAKRFSGTELAEKIAAGEVGVEPSDWGGWRYFGEPHLVRNEPYDGGQYGGDCALRQYAERRMVAA